MDVEQCMTVRVIHLTMEFLRQIEGFAFAGNGWQGQRLDEDMGDVNTGFSAKRQERQDSKVRGESRET